MTKKAQSTSLQRNFDQSLNRLESWADNPWRRYSLFLIILLTSFFLGSSIGMINGVLALMDPIGAFFAVLIIEVMIRARGPLSSSERFQFVLKMIDIARIGFVYGLLLEGFKII